MLASPVRPFGRITVVSCFLTAALGVGCGGEESRESAPPRSSASRALAVAPPAPPDLDRALLLSFSVFPRGPDGKTSSKPGPATFVALRREGGAWVWEAIEDSDSNVFHKVLPFDPPDGEPALLSISGDAARLKLWRKRGGVWSAETLWAPVFGGKHDRLRDVEIADLDGDGQAEIVLATHDQGVVAIGRFSDAGFEVEELDREPRTFVHEIEVGDLDADGQPEIYATPSQPNRLDGDPQSGRVTRYVSADGSAGSWKRETFADLGLRHAKEILIADLDRSGVPELYVAVEAHVENRVVREPVELRRFTAESAPADRDVVAEFDDRLLRFLLPADVDGDGAPELIAAPFKSGLWLLRPSAESDAPFEAVLIDKNSSGFEHATLAADLDGDGRDELYVAADDQGAIRRYVWTGQGFAREEIFRTDERFRGFTWNVTETPVELVR